MYSLIALPLESNYVFQIKSMKQGFFFQLFSPSGFWDYYKTTAGHSYRSCRYHGDRARRLSDVITTKFR